MQVLQQLPIPRARMVRGIVANEVRDGSTPFARSSLPRPAGPSTAFWANTVGSSPSQNESCDAPVVESADTQSREDCAFGMPVQLWPGAPIWPR